MGALFSSNISYVVSVKESRGDNYGILYGGFSSAINFCCQGEASCLLGHETTKDILELMRSHHTIFRSYFLILTLKLRKIY
jgi:hypothetical protein